jgi:phosphoribosyl-AMP cyclohydrolase
MFNNPYAMPSVYNQQDNVTRIDNQIAQLENIKKQIQQPIQQQVPNVTQNFQLAPTREVIRYANNIDEVTKDVVTGDTPFFSRDMSVVWIKNANGDIKTYELNEVVLKDEKDMKIDFLMAQIQELKKGIEKYEHSTNVNGTIENEESTNVSEVSKSTKKSK